MSKSLKPLLLILLLTLGSASFAQTAVVKEDSLECSIYFHQAKWYFGPNLRDNEKRLSRFVQDVFFRDGDPSMSVKRIRVNSGASPEGPQAFNDFLSKERADAIIDYLLKHTDPDESQIILHSPGVDWETLGEARRILPQTVDLQVDLVFDVYDEDGRLLNEGCTVSTNELHVT